MSDFEEADVTPDLEYYDDYDEDTDSFIPATTELNDQCLNVELMPPRSGNEATGRVTARA